MRVRYTKRALGDLADIEAYLRKRSPQGAARIGARIRKRINDLAQFPRQSAQRPSSSVRILVVTRTPYLVIYRVTTEVEIIAIIHSAQERRS